MGVCGVEIETDDIMVRLRVVAQKEKAEMEAFKRNAHNY